ncbi:hypothetical protein JCM9140_2564 [Halalkalibacter wakoensis JCM 9140]|uniref:Uncharacterized protein n=1 Tax=Halalkalibacter wakoensis JCM 9140 TaxID=1236970 RepID=W4Q354_9BACI|nr:hypothetical protein [Halalkalibacter wakoensis]GAE26491.1 hypothetical protein JCM9140_2564 [Halalkalibacter wakoensis JCM 9140]
MINSELFQIMLEQKNLRMEKTKDEHGTFFRTQQALKTGGTVVIVISFHKSEKLIDLNIYNIATMEDNSKNERAL